MNNTATLNTEKTETFSKAHTVQSHSKISAIKSKSKTLAYQQWQSNNILVLELKNRRHNDFTLSGLYLNLINLKTHFTKYDNIQMHHLRQAFNSSNLQQRLCHKKL